METGSSRRLN